MMNAVAILFFLSAQTAFSEDRFAFHDREIKCDRTKEEGELCWDGIKTGASKPGSETYVQSCISGGYCWYVKPAASTTRPTTAAAQSGSAFEQACTELGKVKSVVVDGVACQTPLNVQYAKDYAALGIFSRGNLPDPSKRNVLPWTQDPLNGLQSRSNWCSLAYKWFFKTPHDKRPAFAQSTTCKAWLEQQYHNYMNDRGSGFIPAEDAVAAPE